MRILWYKLNYPFFFFFPAKSNRKLTFLYLANDVIQNSKRKGPEFTREFESVLVDAFSHVARYVFYLGAFKFCTFLFCCFCVIFCKLTTLYFTECCEGQIMVLCLSGPLTIISDCKHFETLERLILVPKTDISPLNSPTGFLP